MDIIRDFCNESRRLPASVAGVVARLLLSISVKLSFGSRNPANPSEDRFLFLLEDVVRLKKVDPKKDDCGCCCGVSCRYLI